MLVRCGGNVIDIGRRQIALVATATLVMLMVSIYSISMLQRGVRRAEADWVQPTPIDHVLQRRHRRVDRVERHSDFEDVPRRKTLKTSGGLTI